MRDLKQISMNGITYSTLDEDQKKEMFDKIFYPKWDEWIDQINKKFTEYGENLESTVSNQ